MIADAADFLTRLTGTQTEWSSVARQLCALLDAEEKELLPQLERAAARSIVQEVRYLRSRCAELESAHTASQRRAFVAEVRAHAHRTDRFGFDFFAHAAG